MAIPEEKVTEQKKEVLSVLTVFLLPDFKA